MKDNLEVEISKKDKLMSLFYIGEKFALASCYASLSNDKEHDPNEFPNFADNNQESKISSTSYSFEEKNEDSKLHNAINSYHQLRKQFGDLPEKKQWEEFELTGDRKIGEFLNYLRNLFNTLLEELKEEDEVYFLKMGYLLARYTVTKYTDNIDNVEKQKQKNIFLTQLSSLHLKNQETKSIEEKLLKLLGDNNMYSYSTLFNRAKTIIFDVYFPGKMRFVCSAIDKLKIISDEKCVLSIVRKVDGVHQEHVFLILEAKVNDKSVIYFMDFVGNSILPEGRNGKVRIFSYENELGDGELLFRCEKSMMDIKKSDMISSTSWNISKTLADKLVETVKCEENNPPKFNVLGQQAISTRSARFSSSVSKEHNCFTWVKEKVINLDHPNISIRGNDLNSYVFSKSNYLLVDSQKQATFWYQEPIAIAAIVGTVAVVGGLALANKEKIYNPCTIQ